MMIGYEWMMRPFDRLVGKYKNEQKPNVSMNGYGGE